LVTAAVALGIWKPWQSDQPTGSPFAVAEAMLRDDRYADAERETLRVFADSPLLRGKAERMAALHLSWARSRQAAGDFRGTLEQVGKSVGYQPSEEASNLRRAALAKAAMQIDSQLVKRAPAAVAVAKGQPVVFRGLLASPLVAELAIDGVAVPLGDDGAFQVVRTLDGKVRVPVRATLVGGGEVTLGDWVVQYEGEPKVAEQPPKPKPEENKQPKPRVDGAVELSVEPAQLVLVGDAVGELKITLPLDCRLVIDGRSIDRTAESYTHQVRSDLEKPTPVAISWSGRGQRGGRSIAVTRRLGKLTFVDTMRLADVDQRRNGGWGTAAATVKLSGRVDQRADRMLVNGAPIDDAEWQRGDVTADVPVAVGANTLVVSFEKRFYEPVSQTLQVTRVAEPLLELVGDTQEKDRVTGASYAVRVRSDLWTDEVVVVRGEQVTELTRDANTREFGAAVPVDAGDNALVVRATNVFGAASERTLTITRAASMARPTLRGLQVVSGGVAQPVRRDRQVFFNAESRLRVDSDDPAAEVLANGVALQAGEDGSYSLANVLTVPCKPTRVSLVVRNDAGKTEPFPFIGWIDATPPQVQTNGPVVATRGQPFRIEGTWVDDGGLQRKGTAIGEWTARLAPGGGVAKKGTWRIEHPGLDASTTLTLVMRDRAGNRSELQVPVTVQQ